MGQMNHPLKLTTEQRIRQFVHSNGWHGEQAVERIQKLLRVAHIYPKADIISLYCYANKLNPNS